MSILRSALLVSTLSLLGLASCDKSESPAGQASKAAEANAANAVAPAAENAEATPTATASNEAADEGGSCGDKAPGECAADKGEEPMAGCNKWDEAADKVAQREVPADAEWHVLKVTGMSCGGCERRIIANVGEMDGVLAVEADSELAQVRIAFAKDDSTGKDAAIKKIGSLGYTVE